MRYAMYERCIVMNIQTDDFVNLFCLFPGPTVYRKGVLKKRKNVPTMYKLKKKNLVRTDRLRSPATLQKLQKDTR